MSNSPQPIPEPLLPEHKLLADAAPKIELSAGFRSQVLAECVASQALAAKLFAAKVAGAIFTALLVGCVAYTWWHSEPTFSPQQQPSTPPIEDVSPASPISSSHSISSNVEPVEETSTTIHIEK